MDNELNIFKHLSCIIHLYLNQCYENRFCVFFFVFIMISPHCDRCQINKMFNNDYYYYYNFTLFQLLSQTKWFAVWTRFPTLTLSLFSFVSSSLLSVYIFFCCHERVSLAWCFYKIWFISLFTWHSRLLPHAWFTMFPKSFSHFQFFVSVSLKILLSHGSDYCRQVKWRKLHSIYRKGKKKLAWKSTHEWKYQLYYSFIFSWFM